MYRIKEDVVEERRSGIHLRRSSRKRKGTLRLTEHESGDDIPTQKKSKKL